MTQLSDFDDHPIKAESFEDMKSLLLIYGMAENLFICWRWKGKGPVCHCGSQALTWMRSVRRYKCRNCRVQFSIKVGTVLQDSPLSMEKWILAIWLLANDEIGARSYDLHRRLNITQKTAWMIMQKIQITAALAGHPLKTFKTGSKPRPPLPVGPETWERFGWLLEVMARTPLDDNLQRLLGLKREGEDDLRPVPRGDGGPHIDHAVYRAQLLAQAEAERERQ